MTLPTGDTTPSCVEICAGAGGQALGLEQAGFDHRLLIEIDADACETLRVNRPNWPVLRMDLREIKDRPLLLAGESVDLLAGGVPCPPFSVAGLQRGSADERDLFPAALNLTAAVRPRAVMVENVKGLLQARFATYRASLAAELGRLGYVSEWRLLQACDYGVPQLRPRAVLVGMQPDAFQHFRWPAPSVAPEGYLTVGRALAQSMASRGWEGAVAWAHLAARVAPTLCGGSRKHGGPDLGPSRARHVWASMGVNGSTVADHPPGPGDKPPIRLTPQQLAMLQGFPPDWIFCGTKTARCRQIGNAFPPPVASAVGASIIAALRASESTIDSSQELRCRLPAEQLTLPV